MCSPFSSTVGFSLSSFSFFAFFSAASLAFFFCFSAADIFAQGLSSGINSAAAAATAAAWLTSAVALTGAFFPLALGAGCSSTYCSASASAA